MRARRGQAMMELAAGMLALAIVVSVASAWTLHAARTLRAQNALRTGGSSVRTDTVEIDAFAREFVYGERGATALSHIEERVTLPVTTIVR